MKTHIDFFETFKAELLGSKKFRNKFIRLWGITTIDGVKVLRKEFTLYPNTFANKDIQRMCDLLGMWSSVKNASFSSVDGYYLYFNPRKDVAKQEELVRELLAEKIDLLCPIDVWKYSTINYIETQEPTKFDGWSKEQILTYIDNDYKNIFTGMNGIVVGDTIEETTLGKYVLFDDGTEFTVEPISSQLSTMNRDSTLVNSSERVRYTSLSVDIRFKRITPDINPNGLLLNAIKTESNAAQLRLLEELQATTNNGGDTGGAFKGRPALTNSLWYKDHLRYDAVVATGLKTKKHIETILTFLDTATVQKKVKWYKKLLGPILLVIAIAIAVFSVGTGAALSTMLTTIALAVGVTVMVMTAIQVKWAKSNGAAASYIGRWIKIGGIISVISGVAAIAANVASAIARQAATTAIAASSGTTVGAASVTTATMSATEIATINTTLNVSTGAFTGAAVEVTKQFIVTGWKSIGMKVAEMAIGARQDGMKADLENKSKYAQDLADQVNDTGDKQLNIGLEDIRVYTDQIESDASRYNFNDNYERELATIHIGNIQRTSFINPTGLNLIAEDLM